MSRVLSRRDAATNHETQTVSLWWSNDFRSYVLWQEVARASWRAAGIMSAVHCREEQREQAIALLAEHMKDAVESEADEIPGGLLNDLLRSAICEVDWYAVAESWVEEIDEGERDAESAGNQEGGE